MNNISQANKIDLRKATRGTSRKKSLMFQSDNEEEAKKMIAENYVQLNNIIDKLDNKIKIKMQFNQSKIVMAYQNHIVKVTKQLKNLKEQHEANEKKFSSDKEILHLTKQCALFRQQAMRLNNQLEDSLDEVQVYKRKTQILDKELKRTNQSLKSMMLSLKKAEREIVELNQSINIKNQDIKTLKTEKEDTIKINEEIKIVQDEKTFEDKSSRTFKNRMDHNFMATFTNSFLRIEKEKKTSARREHHRQHTTFSNRNLKNIVLTQQTQTRPATAIKKNKGLFINELLDKDLQKFQSFIKIIQQARSKEQFKKSNHIESKTFEELIFHDDDVSKLASKLFQNLKVRYQHTQSGTKFIGERKIDNKEHLVYLSTQLMEDIDEKKMKQQQKQYYKSQPHLKQVKKVKINSQYIFNEGLGKQNRIEKLQSSFKKKKIIKNHRKLNFKQLS